MLISSALEARSRERGTDCEQGDGKPSPPHLHGEFDPVAGRRIGNRLQATARRLYDADKKQAEADSERRSFDQCMADALDAPHLESRITPHTGRPRQSALIAIDCDYYPCRLGGRVETARKGGLCLLGSSD